MKHRCLALALALALAACAAETAPAPGGATDDATAAAANAAPAAAETAIPPLPEKKNPSLLPAPAPDVPVLLPGGGVEQPPAPPTKQSDWCLKLAHRALDPEAPGDAAMVILPRVYDVDNYPTMNQRHGLRRTLRNVQETYTLYIRVFGAEKCKDMDWDPTPTTTDKKGYAAQTLQRSYFFGDLQNAGVALSPYDLQPLSAIRAMCDDYVSSRAGTTDAARLAGHCDRILAGQIQLCDGVAVDTSVAWGHCGGCGITCGRSQRCEATRKHPTKGYMIGTCEDVTLSAADAPFPGDF